MTPNIVMDLFTLSAALSAGLAAFSVICLTCKGVLGRAISRREIVMLGGCVSNAVILVGPGPVSLSSALIGASVFLGIILVGLLLYGSKHGFSAERILG